MKTLVSTVSIATILLAGATASRAAQPPLGKTQVLGLIAAGASEGEVAQLVRRDGLTFHASAAFLARLRPSGAGSVSQWNQMDRALASAPVTARPGPANEKAVLAHLSRGAAFELGSPGVKPDGSRAIKELRAALQLDPASAVLQLALARALMCDGEFAAAETEARGAVNTRPELALAHDVLASALAGSGKMDASIAELRTAVALDPDPVFSRSLLARILLDNHNAAGAASELRQGLAAHPDSPGLHDSLGTVLYEQGDTDGALAEFRQSLALGSTSAALRMDLASALRKKGDRKGSIAAIRDALRLAPNNDGYHYMLAEALIDAHRLRQATAELNEVIRINPRFAPAYSERGYVLVRQHHVNQAIQQYRAAIQLDPKLAIAHADLGAAYYRKHDNRDGYREILLAHELAPDEPEITRQFDRLPEKWKRKATQPPGLLRPPSAPVGEPPRPDFLYAVSARTNSILPLEAEAPTFTVKSGLLGTSVYLRVFAERSPVRLRAGSGHEFLIRRAGAAQKLRLRLIRFQSRGGRRTVKLSGSSHSTSNPGKPGFLRISSTAYKSSSIEITIPYRLVPGEYGFLIAGGTGAAMFCFGVDPR